MMADTTSMLDQLRELMNRRSDVHTVAGFKAEVALRQVLALRDTNDRAAHFSPQVEGATRRLADAITSNALRLASVRDVDTLLTYCATLAAPPRRVRRS